MTTKTRGRGKKDKFTVPQNNLEAAESVKRIGDLESQIDSISDGYRKKIASYTEEITALQLKAKTELDPLIERSDMEIDALETFARTNRSTLLPDLKKTVDLSTGTISWRLTPLKVKISNVAKVVSEIKKRRLQKRFIRTKEEVDKSAMLLNARNRRIAMKIPGVSLGQKDEFIVHPNCLNRDIIKGRKRDPLKASSSEESEE